MKDLYKPGRPIDEYLKSDGTMKIDCFTCIHRCNVDEALIGDFLCQGGKDKLTICNPRYGISIKNSISIYKYDYLLWEPRVNVNTFINEKEFKVD